MDGSDIVSQTRKSKIKIEIKKRIKGRSTSRRKIEN